MTDTTFYARPSNRLGLGTLGAAVLLAVFAVDAAQAQKRYASYGHASHEAVQVADHHVFNSDEVVDGATILIRDGRGRTVSASLSSRALEPDTAYSIWWAVFNRPRFCIDPYRCGVADLGPDGDRRVLPSVFWAGGFVSDESGTANTSISLRRGRTNRELFAGTRNYGLRNFWGAEIHVVLRSHGPTGVAGSVATQVGTANEACPAERCKNVFASIHSRH